MWLTSLASFSATPPATPTPTATAASHPPSSTSRTSPASSRPTPPAARDRQSDFNMAENRLIPTAAASAYLLGASLACAQCVSVWQGYSGPALDAPVWQIASWRTSPGNELLIAGGNFQAAGPTSLRFVGA